MINELVNSILEAEDKAEKIVSDAVAKAEGVLEESLTDISKTKAQWGNSMRAESDAILKKYSDEADALYAKILKEGKAEADAVAVEAQKKTDELADDVVRCILSGNC